MLKIKTIVLKKFDKKHETYYNIQLPMYTHLIIYLYT